MMLGLALLAMAADAPNAARAEWALRRAYGIGLDLSVTLCGDAGRMADARRLRGEQEELDASFHRRFGRHALNEIMFDHRGDCEKPDAFRRTVTAYRLALADARDALGTE